jgi:hypothetical protein
MADGHHRYEAALALRDERRLLHGANREDDSEFVLVLLAAVEDEGVMVRPIHRLIAGTTETSAGALIDHLRRWFAIRPAREPIGPVCTGESMFRVVLPKDRGEWDVQTLPGNPHYALMPADKGTAWRTLPVAALQAALDALYDRPLGDDAPEVSLTLDSQDAERRVKDGAALAAFLMPPPRVSQILAVAEEGDLMPAKSTWFEPKAPAGLVINELRCPITSQG